MTLRDLYNLTAAARGHWVLCGTPQAIADTLEEWFVEGAADGFNILPPYFPGAFDDFVDLVVPELQRRGLFRRDYEGTTLRDHLGLARSSPRRPRQRRRPRLKPGRSLPMDSVGMPLLAGFQVVQIGNGLAAAVCGRLLADVGADVGGIDPDLSTPLAAYLNHGKRPVRRCADRALRSTPPT